MTGTVWVTFTRLLILAPTSPKIPALVPLWLPKAPFLKPSHLDLTLVFWTHILALSPLLSCYSIQFYVMDRYHAHAAALAVCENDRFVVPQWVTHKAAEGPVQQIWPGFTTSSHSLTTTLLSHIAGLCPPWSINSISCSVAINFSSTTKCVW